MYSQGKFEETAQLVKRLVASNADLCSMQVTLANMLITGAGWQYINKLLPPKTNYFFESGWLQSLVSDILTSGRRAALSRNFNEPG